MNDPVRLYRAAVGLSDPHRDLSHDDHACRERVLRGAPTLFAEFGPSVMTLNGVAAGLRERPAAVRRAFVDMDDLLATVLTDHLERVHRRLGEASRSGPPAHNRPALRAAYLAATRQFFGGFVPAHQVLLRDRHLLPPDLRDGIERARAELGRIVGGEDWETVLSLLDAPLLDADRIEMMLHADAARGEVVRLWAGTGD